MIYTQSSLEGVGSPYKRLLSCGYAAHGALERQCAHVQSIWYAWDTNTSLRSRNLGTKSSDTLLQSGTNIQRLWELPKQMYSRLALMSSKQIAEHGVDVCWYSETLEWFTWHKQKCTTPYQYSLDCPHSNTNRVIRTNIIKFKSKEHWSDPQHHWLEIEYAHMHTHLWMTESCVIRDWDLKETMLSSVLCFMK